WLPNLFISVVKKVILDLKTHTYEFAKLAHFFDMFGIWSNRSCTQTTTCCNKRGRFLPYNVIVYIFCNIKFSCFFDLKQFSLAHFPHGYRNDLEKIKIIVVN